MKARMVEGTFGFWIELQAETVGEAALLVRLGVNCTKEPPSVYTSVSEATDHKCPNGRVECSLSFRKLKKAQGRVPEAPR